MLASFTCKGGHRLLGQVFCRCLRFCIGSGTHKAQFLLHHKYDVAVSASVRVLLLLFLAHFPATHMNLMKSLLSIKFDPIGYFQLRINGKTDGAVI